MVRFFAIWVSVACLMMVVIFVMMGHTPGSKLAKWRQKVMRGCIKVESFFFMKAAGVVSFKQREARSEAVVAAYKHYLGPDWDINAEEPVGIQISNHTSWMDIMALLYMQAPSFLASEALQELPFMCKIAESFQSLFCDRGGSSESRLRTLKAIEERQVLAEKGEYPVIHIFPEGCTTNKSAIVKFKKGPFNSLRAVRPVVFKYREFGGLSSAQDLLGAIWIGLL